MIFHSSDPQISIIVPVYNVEPYLTQCLESLIYQTFHEIEIICVDDGSTDSCPQILAQYASADSRVRVIKQANAGQGSARNHGIKLAKAPYIMFCDSDDWYELEMCEKMLAAIEKAPGSDMAMCGFNYRYEQKQKPHCPNEFCMPFEGEHRVTRDIMEYNIPAVWSRIHRKSFIDKYNITFPEGVRYEDCLFWYICAVHARGIYFLRENLYNYRQRQGSTMRETETRKGALGLDHVHVAQKLWDYFKEYNLENQWEGYVANLWGELIKAAYYYSPAVEIRRRISALVHDFTLRECHPDTGLLSPLLVRALMASLKSDVIKKKYILGLLQVRSTTKEKIVQVCGISVYRVKYRSNGISWRIFGIPYRWLRPKSSSAILAKMIQAYNARRFFLLIQSIRTRYDLPLVVVGNDEVYVQTDNDKKDDSCS